MLTATENERLCRVENDAPMGRLMRQHWVPALLSEQISKPDGAPIRIQLFGEKLVAFRDSNGKVGILGENCPHRKASLAFGRNEECGLRCLYHGWKFDTDGNVIDMPSEPKQSALPDKAKHLAYPAQEAGGFVWAYMGAPDQMPQFEAPPWAPHPGARVAIAKIELPCNWAQIMEGQIDSAHSSTLHSSDMRPAKGDAAAKGDHWVRPSTDKNPRIQVQLTNYGMRYAAIRRPIVNANTHDYVRITTFVAPFMALIPPNSSYNVASVIVPRSDDSSYFNFIAWSEGDQARHRHRGVAQVLRSGRRRRCRRPVPSDQTPCVQRLSSGPRHDEGRSFHRHSGNSQPGHRDVGVDGTDRRSDPGASGRKRHRDRAVPPPDAERIAGV